MRVRHQSRGKPNYVYSDAPVKLGHLNAPHFFARERRLTHYTLLYTRYFENDQKH